MQKSLAQPTIGNGKHEFDFNSNQGIDSTKPLPVSQASPNQNLGNVIYLGVCFMVLFNSFSGVQNILNLVLVDLGLGKLGNMSLLSVYFAFGIGSIIAPQFVKILEYRYTFALSSSTFILFMLAGKFIASCAGDESFSCSSAVLTIGMTISSSFLGLGCAVLWMAQSLYVTECATTTTRGKFFGIFWSLMQSSQVTGNFLASWLWQQYGPGGLFNFMLIISLFAVIGMLGVKQPDKVVEELEVKTSTTTVLELQNMDLNKNLVDSNQIEGTKNEPGLPPQQTGLPDWNKTIQFCLQPKFQVFVPLFLVSSYSIFLYISYLGTLVQESVKVFAPDQIGIMVGYVLLTLGICQVLAGQAFGYLMDKDRVKCVRILYIVNIAILFFVFMAYVFNSYKLYFVCAALFAFADTGSQTVQATLLSLKFTEKFEPFAGFRAYLCCSGGLFFFMFMWLQGEGFVISLMIYAGIIFYGWINMWRLFTRQ